MNEITNKNKTLSLTKKLVITGALSALVIVLGSTNLGMIPLGPAASITILQIPVIIAVMLVGLPSGLFVGAVFGILSLILAAVRPSGVLDPLFVNPLCSVLPRMLLAVAAWGIWKLLTIIPKFPKIVAAGITGFAATFVHTLLVIGCIYIFEGTSVKAAMGGMGYFALIGVLTPQALMEAAGATVVCAAVYTGLYAAGKSKSKLSQETDTEPAETSETKTEDKNV